MKKALAFQQTFVTSFRLVFIRLCYYCCNRCFQIPGTRTGEQEEGLNE